MTTPSFHHVCKHGHEWYNAHPGARKCPICNPPETGHCIECGAEFVKHHKDRQFCGDTCKKRHARAQKRPYTAADPNEGGAAREVRLRNQGEARTRALIDKIVERAKANGTCYGPG